MNIRLNSFFLFILSLTIYTGSAHAQSQVIAKIDPPEILVGDHMRMFLEVRVNAKEDRVIWATIPDTFSNLEIIERGGIDTTKQGDSLIFRQRLILTGFDSGLFQVPAFAFTMVPVGGGNPYEVKSDSFKVLVQTVAVDTTQPFKGIKGIKNVRTSWRDYLGYIIAGAIILPLVVFIAVYWSRKRKKVVKPGPPEPVETLTDRYIRLLGELDAKNIWQSGEVKEYYTQLTAILRLYIEERFNTPAMEITTDELLYKARVHRELMRYVEYLSGIMPMADLAKFAKEQLTPAAHIEAMEEARQFIISSKPNIVETTQS